MNMALFIHLELFLDFCFINNAVMLILVHVSWYKRARVSWGYFPSSGNAAPCAPWYLPLKDNSTLCYKVLVADYTPSTSAQEFISSSSAWFNLCCYLNLNFSEFERSFLLIHALRFPLGETAIIFAHFSVGFFVFLSDV